MALHGIVALIFLFSFCNCQVITLPNQQYNQIFRRETKNFTLDNGNTTSLQILTNQLYTNGFRRYLCYIRANVYKSSQKKYPASKVPVYALTSEPSTTKYIGFSVAESNSKGIACVLTVCGKNALIFADTGLEKLFLFDSNKQTLPSGLNYTKRSQTEAFIQGIEEIPNFFEPPGPIYTRGYLQMCNTSQNDYSISFHFLGIRDQLTKANNSKQFDVSTSWYPYRDEEPEYRVCFLKVKIQTDVYNVTVSVDSVNGVTGFWYGNFAAGPKENPKNTDSSNRAACIEYRCPYRSDITGDEIPTNVTGQLKVPYGVKCNVSNIANDLKQFNITNSGFAISLSSDVDYGPKAGIYNSVEKRTARHLCFTGSNAIGNDQYEMNPNTYFAIEYICK